MRIRLALCLLLYVIALVPTGPNVEARVLATTSCTSMPLTGVLLLRPVNSIGTALRGLIAIDPATGDRIGEIDVPLIDDAFPTALPGKAIAISGNELYLVDTSDFSATPVSLGKGNAADLSPNQVQFRGTAGTRFMLFGSPSFDQVYLIDVQLGVATDLSVLIPTPSPDSPVVLSFAAVTPDDAHVLAWDGRHVYVFETENPTGARQVDTGAFAFAPDFSPDGSELIYSTSDGPGSGSTLILESFDGSDSQVIRSSAHAQVTLWIPGGRTLFVDERTEDGAAAGIAFVLDLETGEETRLISYSGSLTSVQLSADGEHALLGVEMMGGGDWSIANLATGDVVDLPQLAGGKALPGLYADAPWSLVVPFGEDSDPLAGPSYRGVNLDTGEVGRLLEQSPDLQFVQQPLLSSDGRYSLVIGQTDSRQTLWLLDAEALQATQIAEGPTVTAQFSPDGCQVAVTRESRVDGFSSFAVSIVASEASTAATMAEPYGSSQYAAWVR